MPGKNREFRIGDEDFPSLGNAYPKIYSAKDVEKSGNSNSEQKQVLKDKSVIKNNDKTSCDKLSSNDSKTKFLNTLSNDKINTNTTANEGSQILPSCTIKQKSSNFITDRLKKLNIDSVEEVDSDVLNSKYPCAVMYRKLVAKELSQAGIDATKILEDRIEDELVGNSGGYFDIPEHCLENGLCPYGLRAFKNFYDHMQKNKDKYISYCYKDDLSTLLDDCNLLKGKKLCDEIGSATTSSSYTPTNHFVKVPKEYMISKNVPTSKFPATLLTYEKLGLDTLFYLFFNCIGESLQVGAAHELNKREWFFHNSLKTWIKPVIVDSSLPNQNTETYRIFNVVKWLEEVVTMSIDWPTEIELPNHVAPLPDIVINYIHKRYPYSEDEKKDDGAKVRYEQELFRQEMHWERLFKSTWLHYLSPRDAEMVTIRYLFQFSDPEHIEKIINSHKPRNDIPPENKVETKEKNSLHSTMNRYRESMNEKPLSKRVLHEAVMRACSNQTMNNFQNLTLDHFKMNNNVIDQKLENIINNSGTVNASHFKQPIVDSRQMDLYKTPRHLVSLNDPKLNEMRENINQCYKLDITPDEFYKISSTTNDLGGDIKRITQEKDNIQNGTLKPDPNFQDANSNNYRNQFEEGRLPNAPANGIYPYAEMVSQIAARHQQQLKPENNIPNLPQHNIEGSFPRPVTNSPCVNNSQIKYNGPLLGPPPEHIKLINELMASYNQGMISVGQNGGPYAGNPQILNRMGPNEVNSIMPNNFPNMLPQCSPQGSQHNCNSMFTNPTIPILPPQGFPLFPPTNIQNFGIPIPPIPMNSNSMMFPRNNFTMLPNINYGAMNLMRGGMNFHPTVPSYENGENSGDSNNSSFTSNNGPFYPSEN